MDKTTLPSQIIVKGQIADASGHTDFTGTIDEAMTLIMEQVTKAGKWVYVNGNPFMFTNNSIAEQDELRNMLTTSAEPTFMLTAKLQGGASVNVKVTGKPLSSVINKRRRAHIAVSFRTLKGKPVIDVTASSRNGVRKKLQKHREEIIAAVFAALR